MNLKEKCKIIKDWGKSVPELSIDAHFYELKDEHNQDAEAFLST